MEPRHSPSARIPLAEAVVYTRGPGRVARCRTCGEILAVLVTIHGITCVDLGGVTEA